MFIKGQDSETLMRVYVSLSHVVSITPSHKGLVLRVGSGEVPESYMSLKYDTVKILSQAEMLGEIGETCRKQSEIEAYKSGRDD